MYFLDLYMISTYRTAVFLKSASQLCDGVPF